MKKALILGISGQDGSYLCHSLLEKGYEVIGTSRDAQMSTFNNLERLGIRDDIRLESVSLNDFRSVLQTVDRHKPDEIYNLTGQGSVGLSFDHPVETFQSICIGTLNLLEVIRFLGAPIRFYNAASSECFGDTDGQAANEKSPLRPKSPYGVAKAAGFWQTANYREAYGLFVCSGILFNHESPLRHQRFVTRKIVNSACRIANGKPGKLVLGNIEIERDWGWAPEYVEAMWLLLQQEKPEDYVIATGETHTLKEFTEAVFSSLGLNWEEYVEISTDLFRPVDILKMKADPGRAERELGWKASYRMHDVARMMVEEELKDL
ncbi:MAG TPA: GDP-mannose 4,6-dehydratase [Desulfobacteraceae bacterium]|nr:GDP-mannose 4,6-dehydratase [Desulfobacteraceae bacterium]HPJ68622.1 GDP-mannose 4,6-dehydratase [Desulfobacteraceae bacterium]HPQ27528.1 GDP-mannose 4,6-dehydratase [Desulfobacteraceae bacterium]